MKPLFGLCSALLGLTIAATSLSAADTIPALPQSKILTVVVGGGSSHDFGRWFNMADVATLKATDKADVLYTEKPDSIVESFDRIGVLYLSNNQPMTNSELRTKIFAHADAGKGLLLVHPALWYNWKDWPEYNRVLVGGGSRSHDKYGEFEVTVTAPDHPLMKGVPATFKITDELYHFEKDEKGSEIEVLATGKNLATGKTYPVAWVTKHAKSRIVCITLGHDGQSHDHPAYKTLLQNSLLWVAKK